MAVQYTDWAKVLSLYENASDIEASAPAQVLLLQRKSEEFGSFIRKIHKAPLRPVTGTVYDELVQMAVAHLVIEELRQRRHTDDTEVEFMEFPHIAGKFTSNGLQGHGIIAGILKGAIVLAQDHAERDVKGPEAVPIVQTGSGAVDTYLPYKYDSKTVDNFRIVITTAGRADVESARFTLYKNNDDAGKLTGQIASSGLHHLGGGLYVRFVDLATAGASFALNDEFLITAVPIDADRQGSGPRSIQFFGG